MTIKKIIIELYKDYNHYVEKSKEEGNTYALSEFYDGYARGIKNALCWLIYLDNKNKN